MSTHVAALRPSWMLTISLCVALMALFFTSGLPIIPLVIIIALWPHFVPARLPRDASSVWIIRLVIYGAVFTFFGTKPGMGADWIFDAKTFNMIGLIAAGEAVLELWREPPPGARYHTVTIFCTCVVFMAACNTYDRRYIILFAPLYILFTLLALREWRNSDEAPDRSTPDWKTPLLRTQARTIPGGRGLLALLVALILGASMHVSVLENREVIMRWGFRLMRDRAFLQGTGISNQPDLGRFFNARGGTQRVLKIDGALADGHLRAAAFDTYANGRWSPILTTRRKDIFPERPAPENNKTFRARITKLSDLDKLIFAPLNAVALMPSEGSSFDWDRNLGPVICEDPAPYSYDVFWNEKGVDLGVPLHQGVLCVPVKKGTRKALLQLPREIDPRVKTLALDLTASALDDAEKVESIAEFLLKNNQYSRFARRGRGEPVSNFILEKRAAHCEFFASATVVMLRAVGVPSRYVTGYMAHEPSGNGTVVRQRDAHAWAEAWIGGVGWIAVDTTPADGTPAANGAVGWWQRAWEKMQDTFLQLREKMTALSRTQIFVLVMVVVGVWLLERARIRRKNRLANAAAFEYSSPADMAALSARFETLLRKENAEISPAKPLAEYSHHEATQTFLNNYNCARFGGQNSEQALRDLTQQIEKLEKGI